MSIAAPLTPNDWIKSIERVASAVERLGGKRDKIVTKPPATPRNVEKVERKINQRLPASFRDFLTSSFSSLEFSWWLPDKVVLPKPLRGIFSGMFDGFGLEHVGECEGIRQGWIETCFPDPDNPYDRVWQGTLAFMHVPNGDLLAFDLATGGDAAVIYLNHEGGDSHGKRLADNFADLMNRWSPLGCPGCEDWQWEPFCDTSSGLIDPNGPNARKWKKWLGIS